MGRKGFLFGGLVIALSLGWQTAQAGDHRSTTSHGERGTADTMISSHQMLGDRHDSFAFSSVKPSGEVTAAPHKPAAENDEKESATEERSPRKKITFFQFNSRLGQVAFQPVVAGGAKGAQFSIGF
jgi:hypothetical protein